MNILITGSAGFIGNRLVQQLIAQEGQREINIVGVDNINDYYSQQLKYDRLQQCGIVKSEIKENEPVYSSKYSNYCFYKTDLVDLSTLEHIFKQHRIDYVINLAAQAGVRYSLENPHSYVQSNVVGFVNLLECCRYNNIKHFIYASSSSVYGGNEKTPFAESDRVDYPVSLYAATKKSNELMAHTYSHLYSLPTTGLRFFTVYGPWGRPDMAPMLFTDAIYNNRPIKIFNMGDMKRDFTYIDDIVEGVIKLINKKPNEKKEHPFYQILNIGNSEPIKLMDFISCLENALGKEAKKEYLPMQDGDVKITYADTTELSNITGYKPSTSLDLGVSKFVDWYTTYFNV